MDQSDLNYVRQKLHGTKITQIYVCFEDTSCQTIIGNQDLKELASNDFHRELLYGWPPIYSVNHKIDLNQDYSNNNSPC